VRNQPHGSVNDLGRPVHPYAGATVVPINAVPGEGLHHVHPVGLPQGHTPNFSRLVLANLVVETGDGPKVLIPADDHYLEGSVLRAGGKD